MKRLLNILIAIGFGFGYLFVFLYGFWQLYPYNPLVFSDPKFPVLTKTIRQGGNLQYVSNYCKYMSLTATTAHTFANDLIFSTPETTTNRETGCHSVVISVPIPRELPPGTYHLENTYTYQVNPVKTIVITHSTENFKVTE